MGRCRLHGGASTGPRTKDGLKRLVESKIKHGRFTKAEREKAKQISEKRRKIQNELKELESWFVDYGHLEKNCHVILYPPLYPPQSIRSKQTNCLQRVTAPFS